MRQIPRQLRNEEFRFHRIPRNKKSPPLDPRWNSDGGYMHFEAKLRNHLIGGGNVGIATGIGGLVVIDFDCPFYQSIKEDSLPKTFTVKSAGKGLHHYYYKLEGDMIGKVGVGLQKRLADIQGAGAGVVCPPSSINRKPYQIVDDSPVRPITARELKKMLGVDLTPAKERREYEASKPCPEAVKGMVALFKELRVKRVSENHFKCPLHPMSGGGNLVVYPDGHIHCFHCNLHCMTVEQARERLKKLEV